MLERGRAHLSIFPTGVLAVMAMTNEFNGVRELSMDEIDEVNGALAPAIVAGAAIGGG